MIDYPRNESTRPPISSFEMEQAIRAAHIERSRYLGQLFYQAGSAVLAFARRAPRVGSAPRHGGLSGRPAV